MKPVKEKTVPVEPSFWVVIKWIRKVLQSKKKIENCLDIIICVKMLLGQKKNLY